MVFLLDQVLHLATLMVAALLLTGTSFRTTIGVLQVPEVTKIHILEIAIVYAAVVFGGGYFIRSMTKGMAKKAAAESSPPLDNAGLYIGWLERSLVITAIALQSPALVGLILTGKSIARLPEFKEAKFAEYFLIGTLLSMLLALLGGIALLELLYGSVSLK